jgi:type IV pilus assembly protein PilO
MGLLDPIREAPRFHKIIAGILLMVLVGGFGYFLLIAPRVVARDALRQWNDTLRAQVLKARADEANLRVFRVQAEALRKRLAIAKERLPSEKEMPRLYRQVSDLAFQSGLAVALFQPRAPQEREILSEVPISVTSEGGFHQFGTFFARMGRLPRIVNLGDFRMTGIDRPTGTIRADFTLATYMLRPEGAPPPRGAAPAAKPAPAAAPAAPAPGLPPAPRPPGAGR